MQATRSARTRRVLLVVVALLSVAVGLVTYATGALHALDLDTMNVRFAVRGTQQPPADMVIVRIDDPTFFDLHTQLAVLLQPPRAADQRHRRRASEGDRL